MDPRKYLGTLRRSFRLVAVTALVIVSLAAVVTLKLTPLYESSARLYVSSEQADPDQAYAGGLLSAQRVAAYVQIVESDLVADKVREHLNLDVTLDELEDEVSASVVGQAPVLQIRVKDADPIRARAIAQAYADQMVLTAEDVENRAGGSAAPESPVKATVIDPASTPTSPVFPKPVLNLSLAALVGLLIGVALALLRELFDNTVKGVEDLGPDPLPLLGTIATDPDASRGHLAATRDERAPRLEAFRVLRTNLQFVDVDDDHRVFVVTSPSAGEGKTTIVVDLALSLAGAGVRTLLIDGDLRKPRVAATLDLDSSIGLTTVLLGSVEILDALQPVRDNLDVLTSGLQPPNAAELLQSNTMRVTLDKLRSLYDVVLIDSPPVLPVADAPLLATLADGALVVLRYGKTTVEQWETARDRLRQVDASVVGVVVNMAPVSSGTYRYYGTQPEPRRKRR